MISKSKSIRQSNIELLRILSMFFVLIGHINGLIIGLPNKEFFTLDLSSSFLRVLIQGISVVGVNIFVLISGWFGIKTSLKGGSAFIFQFLFLFFEKNSYYKNMYLLNLLIYQAFNTCFIIFYFSNLHNIHYICLVFILFLFYL